MLVLSIDREPWRSIEREGQRSTWAAPSSLDREVPVLFYRGRRTGPVRFGVAAMTRFLDTMGADRRDSMTARARAAFLRRVGRHFSRTEATTADDLVVTHVPETYAMVATKAFVALRHVLDTEPFDFVLRTNTSTYVDRQRLLDLAGDAPRSGYWGGFPGEHDGIAFTSGAGTLLSRDVAAAAVASDWDWARIDDVALGEALGSLGIERRALARPVLTSIDQVATTDLDACMWRCKGEGERNDVAVMTALHEALDRRR